MVTSLPPRNIVSLVTHSNQQMLKWFEDVTAVVNTGVADGDKGDITVSGFGEIWTIDAGAVTLGKLSEIPALTILGNATGGVDEISPLDAATAKTVLGLAPIASSGSADDLTAGVIPGAVFDDTSHGNRGGGPLHALAVASGDAGFMTGADKAKLDGIVPPIAYRSGTVRMIPATGLFVANADNGTADGTQAQIADRSIIAPFVPAYDLPVDQLGVSISTLLGANNARVIIHAADANGRPSTLITESPDITTAAAVTVMVAITPITLNAGQTYWVGIRASGAFTLRTLSESALPVLSVTTAATPVIQQVLIRTETFASPATDWTYAGSQHSNALMPRVLMRVG